MLNLNGDKTELLVICPKHKPALPIDGTHVAGEYIVSNYAKSIGVITFVSYMNLENHVIDTCKTTLKYS